MPVVLVSAVRELITEHVAVASLDEVQCNNTCPTIKRLLFNPYVTLFKVRSHLCCAGGRRALGLILEWLHTVLLPLFSFHHLIQKVFQRELNLANRLDVHTSRTPKSLTVSIQDQFC